MSDSLTTDKTERRKPTVQKAIDLNQLAREDEAIVVQNQLGTISVLVIKINGNEEISEFAANGDPSGEDIMELPSTYLKNAQFRKQLLKKVYKIVEADDPDVLIAIEAQQNAWDTQQRMKEEAASMVASQQPRSYSGTPCIAQEGKSICGEFAISSKATNTEKPPLCSKHAHLAGQFTPEETGEFIDTKPALRWNRVQIQR